jgi:hypothetical protein
VAGGVGRLGRMALYAATYNCAGAAPAAGLFKDMLRASPLAHVYVVSLQALPPAAHDAAAAAVCDAVGPEHALASRVSANGLLLLILAHNALCPFVSEVEHDVVALGGFAPEEDQDQRTKGAVAVAFKIAGRSVVVCNAHFKGKVDSANQRNANFHEIDARLRLPGGVFHNHEPVPKRFDFCFFMGDLNYRIADVAPKVLQQALASRNFAALHKFDQLRSNKSAFQGYAEAPLDFDPTFKLVRGKHQYDSSKPGMLPSWTDRILYTSREPGRVQNHAYDCLPNNGNSTHLPVWGLYALTLDQPGALVDKWAAAQAEAAAAAQARHGAAQALPKAATDGNGASQTCSLM